MLKLIVNNLKERKVGLHELNSEELTETLHYAVANQDLILQREIGNHFTHIYDQTDEMPYWFKSEYDDDFTIMNFGQRDKVVDWSSVTLDDGLPLTHSKHKPLLNGFKNWLLAVSNPLENGGAVIKTSTVKKGVDNVLSLIDAILLRSAALELSQYHLSHITADFWLSLFKSMSEDGPQNGIYDFTGRTVELVKVHASSITQEQVKAFVSKYPFVSRDIAEDDLTLFLTKEERVRACCWLYAQGYYKFGSGSGFNTRGNGAVLEMLLFEGKIASPALSISTSPELWLAEKARSTEYRPFYTENSETSAAEVTISIYISIARLINTNILKDNASSPLTDATKALSVRKIKDLVTLKPAGRTQTLHPDVAFKLTRQSFEFVLKYQKDILDACLLGLSQAVSKSTKSHSNKERPDERRGKFIPEIHQNMPFTERSHFMQTKVMRVLNEKAVKAMGIRQVLPFEVFAADKYCAIRNNESLFELYGVLIGSCQYLTGIISARRQDELISLTSSGNLSPNLSPFENEDIEYNLIFKLKKSGNGGKLSTNKTIERPITASLAKIIWRLEAFNEAAISQGVVKGKALGLFNSLGARMCHLTKPIVSTFNLRLDLICDYFETPLVKMSNGELRRQYVRQHQLRRFFALLFFWQKRFQGLEALRWMLGHTDMSHLYHYISSNEVGDILNGVKATVIVQGVLNKDGELEKLKSIGELKATLAKKYNAGAVIVDDLESVIDLADDDDITVPHIDQLKAEANLESNLEELLKTGEISLEPNFFKITDEDGQVRETFNLAFQVKGL